MKDTIVFVLVTVAIPILLGSSIVYAIKYFTEEKQIRSHVLIAPTIEMKIEGSDTTVTYIYKLPKKEVEK